MQPYIFDISRCSLHDGPGVRTVIYLKGCSLACVWCHNPEGISQKQQVLFYPERCIGCNRCIKVCPQRYIAQNNEHVFLREGCTGCFACCDACPANALLPCGKSYTPKELMVEIKKDMGYYERSGGGITFSGGEALLYPDYVKEVFSLSRACGIHTAVETALNVPRENIDAVLAVTDLLICDFKCFSNDAHKALTGRGNEQILKNLEYLAQQGSELWVRIPCIPTLNDSEDNLIASGKFLGALGVKRVELLRYNNLAENKYKSLGLTSNMPILEPQTTSEMQRLAEIIKPYLAREAEVLFS